MLNSGPQGFSNAPFSKTLVLVTSVVSVVVGTKRTPLYGIGYDLVRKGEFHKLLANPFTFSSVPESIFGILLLYNFRLFERQMGTVKYSSFVFLATIISSMIQLVLATLWQTEAQSSGPYGAIFACCFLYRKDIPSTASFRFMNIKFTEKFFTYLMAAQLMFNIIPAGDRSRLVAFIPSAAGLAAGALYRANFLQMRRFKFPAVVNKFCRGVFTILDSFLTFDGPPAQHGQRGQRRTRGGQREAHMQGYRDTLLGPDPGHAQGGFMPMQPPVASAPPPPPSPEAIQSLVDMGFGREAAVRALQESGNNVELATNRLLDGRE